MNNALQEKVQKTSCSNFAKHEMIEAIRISMKADKEDDNTDIEASQYHKKDQSLPGVFALCGFDTSNDGEGKHKEQKWKELPLKKQIKS